MSRWMCLPYDVAKRGRALVLGGTEFLGIHLVERLLAHDWQVTLFNRGVTNDELFDTVSKLRGDRDGDVAALDDGRWEVVYDLSGYHPDQIARSAAHLAQRCDHYVFVSTVSVYENFRNAGTTETAALVTWDGPLPTEVDAENAPGWSSAATWATIPPTPIPARCAGPPPSA